MNAHLISARATHTHEIELEFDQPVPTLTTDTLELQGDAEIRNVRAEGARAWLETSELSIDRDYWVRTKEYGALPVDLGVLLDKLVSDKPLGCTVEAGRTWFRVFAPRARRVSLVLFERPDQASGREFEMRRAKDGVWEYDLAGTHWGKSYGYKVAGPEDPTEIFAPQQVLADPYARAVCTRNTYRHEARTLILEPEPYDWQGDTFVSHAHEDLIIYEAHVRDLTVHPSAGARAPGTYRGLAEKAGPGGLSHLLELGVNAVELLPCQDFAAIEIPFGVETNGVTNTWNPYARNHWGYMTSYFFAPEAYYAGGGHLRPGEVIGVSGEQVRAFKDLVKALHREGLAVILDVVYNHVSEYDWNPFKYIDKKYYFRLDPQQEFLTLSGCGNDFKTERPMARRMILDSLTYWMREYHIDGFRFDLATMLDWETVERITEETRKLNPHVILIAEPWGGGKYDLAGFSERGWAAWNDLFRNGVKGQNPVDGLSWTFGTYWNGNHRGTLESYVRGSTRAFGGPFKQPNHSVNYLESHDDYTLGDFIRIGTGRVKPGQKIRDVAANAKLTRKELRLHKLAAAFLLTSQGIVMIAQGQDFARSKVIAPTNAPDPHVGELDHNSYNKDNETNWLNFEHKELNRELFDYYRGLIALRKAHPAFRRTPGEAIRFLDTATEFALGYHLPQGPSGDRHDFVVLLNAHPDAAASFSLPEGRWRTVVDAKRAGTEPFGQARHGAFVVPPRSAFVLMSD